MITGLFSREEVDFNVPRLVWGEYVGKLGGKGFVKISKPVQEVADDLVL